MAKAELTFRELRQLPPQVRQRLEAYLLEFERNWHRELFPEYAKQIPEDLTPYRVVCLVELAMIDLERQWGAGQGVPIKDYLANFPELGTAETVTVELLLAECQAREMAGEQSVMAKVAERFPKRGTELNEALKQRDGSWAGRKSHAKSAGTRQAAVETKRVAKNKKTTPKQKPALTPPFSLSELPVRFGRYQIEKQLGAGGMGAVYLAHDTQLDRPVALKIPKFEGSETEEMLDRFYREARSAATLRHANICPVYDVDQIEGTHFLTMAYLEGRPLEDYIQRAEKIPERTAASLIRKVALGLEQAHAAGVIHRDLKPANIMIDSQKEPVITDFGLARNVNASEESRVTKQNMIMGTPAYMSPEQVDGDFDVGPLSDIYSLGVILYELLTGCLPFDGLISEVLKGILLKEPPQPSQHRPDLDPQIEAICLKMMAKAPNQRYADAREVVDVLTNYLKGNPPTQKRIPEKQSDGSDSRQTFSDESGLSDFLGSLRDKQATATLPPTGTKSRRRRSKSPSLTLLSLAVFGLMAAALYGVVLLVRGPDGGMLRVEVDDPNLEVLVDDDSITLKDKTWEGEKAAKQHTLAVKLGDQQLNIGSPTVIHLPDGRTETHQLQLELNGTRLASDTFEIARGETTVLKISRNSKVQSGPSNSSADQGAMTTSNSVGSVYPGKALTDEMPSATGNPPSPIGQTTIPTGENDGWVSLFDGETLSGWEQHNGTATYRVEDGMIVGNTWEGSPNSYLCSKENYSDFELKFEVKVDDELNSGVQIRSVSDPSIKNGRVHGPQVEIATDGAAGFIYGEGLGTGWLSSDEARADTKKQTAFKKGEWNKFHVKVVGKSIKTWVNGLPVADLLDEKSGMYSGFIGLQVHSIQRGTGPYEVRWRNLELKDLSQLGRTGQTTTDPASSVPPSIPPSGQTPSSKSAQTGLLSNAIYRDDKWVPLTNGKDLSGWSGFNSRGIHWEVEGPVLRARNRSNRVESGGAIFTIAEYRDFHFRCEVLALSDGGGAILFRNSGGVGKGRRRGYLMENLSMKSAARKDGWGIGSLFADDFQVPHDRTRLMPSSEMDWGIKAGDWYQLEFIALGNAVEIRINGKLTASYVSSDPRLTKAGKIGLNCGRGSYVVYRNLEIRELAPRSGVE